MTKKRGKFISIEGTEGAGKSTTLTYLQHYFTEQGISYLLTREPGGTPFAEELRTLLLHREFHETITADSELLLMFAGRSQHIHHVILPALARGEWVISDRYIDATYAYQGGGRQLNMQNIQILDDLIVKNIYPDLTLLMDISVEKGLARAEKRNTEKDRIEKETIEFFERVRQVYLSRAKNDPTRIKIIAAEKNIADVEQQIKIILDEFIKSSAA